MNEQLCTNGFWFAFNATFGYIAATACIALFIVIIGGSALLAYVYFKDKNEIKKKLMEKTHD